MLVPLKRSYTVTIVVLNGEPRETCARVYQDMYKRLHRSTVKSFVGRSLQFTIGKDLMADEQKHYLIAPNWIQPKRGSDGRNQWNTIHQWKRDGAVRHVKYGRNLE